MTLPVIQVENLSKCYTMWKSPRARLQHPIMNAVGHMFPFSKFGLENPRTKAKRLYQDFWALNDVSFHIDKGECVGVVGRNGSGKSTLLQILAGTLQPTSGNVFVRGRVAALLELGSGFNPEFTGRENIYLNAAVLGLSRERTEERMEDIISFADIHEFIDQPLKTYSSGMMMRLAFAVNTCVDPDILIVDEALAVGDAPFQAKCFRRLRALMETGISILLVSHDIYTIKSVCNRALWMKGGKLHQIGSALTVGKAYEKFCFQEQGVQGMQIETEESGSTQATAPQAEDEQKEPSLSVVEETVDGGHVDCDLDTLLERYNLLNNAKHSAREGNGRVIMESLVMVNEEGVPTRNLQYNEEVTLHYKLRAKEAVDSDIMVGMRIRDVRGHFVLSLNDLETIHHLKMAAGEVARFSITFRLPLTHSNYSLRTGVFGFQNGNAIENGKYDYNRAEIWDLWDEALHFKMNEGKQIPLPGPVHVHAPIVWQPQEAKE
jgi:lipopolysaccharide transport system ATP-binding protein